MAKQPFIQRAQSDAIEVVKHIPEEWVLRMAQRGLTNMIRRETSIVLRERLRTIREEIILIKQTVY